MRALLLLTGTLLLASCGGSDDPEVVGASRDYAKKALGDTDGAYDGALDGNWTRAGTKVILTDPDRQCDENTKGCSPVVVVVCLRASTPISATAGSVGDRISERACRPA